MRPHPARAVLLAAWIGLSVAASCATTGVDVSRATRMLEQADRIKTARHDAFLALLKQLDADSARLTPQQGLYLRYLKAWQLAYSGHVQASIVALDAVIHDSSDPTLRLRAGVSVVNVLSLGSRHQEAYSRLSQLLDDLPRVSDRFARSQALGVASQLYTLAGQHDLGLEYARKYLAENPSVQTKCQGAYLELLATRHADAKGSQSSRFADALAACKTAGMTLTEAIIRTLQARFELTDAQPAVALATLRNGYEETQATHYPPAIASAEAALALAYEKLGDLPSAQQHASRALAAAPQATTTEEAADALGVLYRVAKRRGDLAAALAWHEQWAAADKGYLDAVSARAMAFQMVHQQVLAKKAEVAALNQKNQVLKLSQVVDRKNLALVQLGIALALVLAGSIALYAWRTRRSQRKFQKLAQRDGLTEIHNRPYFFECAERELAYCRKSMRAVSAIAIDLDHFKQINDTHGHAAGDIALKRAVAACRQHLRSVDIFGRLGGEEFGIVLPDCPPERALAMAEAMRRQIAALQHSRDGLDFPLTASFGVSTSRDAGYDLERLLAQADGALYQAKHAGRNRVVVHAANDAEPPPAGTPDTAVPT